MKKPEITQFCIEKARQKLYLIADQHENLWNPKVIKQSMVLDELINRYYRENKSEIGPIKK